MAKKKDGVGSVLFGHAIAFVGCVLFPGFVTAVAPVSWVRFERTGENVSAKAQVCAFFVVPYRTMVIDPVVGVGDRFVAGHITDSDRRRNRNVRSEDEAFLEIHGKDESFSVPVTPFNIESISRRAHEFLDDPSSTELRMTVVANWKFSVIGGGLVSLLTVLYVVGVGLSILAVPSRLLKRVAGIGSGPETLRDDPNST